MDQDDNATNYENSVATVAHPNANGDEALRTVQPFLFRALAIWGFFYMLLAQSFAIWKWQTPTLLEEEPNTIANASQDDMLVLQSLRLLIPKMQDAVQKSQQRNRWVQQQLNLDQGKLSTSSSDDGLDDQSIHLPDFIRAFVMSNDLDAMAVLNERFTVAMDELQHLSAQKKWSGIESIFMIQEDFLEPSDLSSDCSSPYALEEQIENLQFYLDNEEDIFTSDDSLPMSFSNVLQSLQQHLQATIQQVYSGSGTNPTDSPSGTVEEEDSEPRNCLPSTDFVISWLNVGLDFIQQQRSANPDCALAQHRMDLRPVLLKSMVESGIDASHVILEADVSTWDDVRCHGRVPRLHRRSMRQWLDQPSLHASLTAVDALLDWLNGKNDILDDLMDRYIYSKNAFSLSESILSGMLVSFILDVAGHLPSNVDPFNLTMISVRS